MVSRLRLDGNSRRCPCFYQHFTPTYVPTSTMVNPLTGPPQPPYGQPTETVKGGTNTMTIVLVVLGGVALVALIMCAGMAVFLYPAIDAARSAARRAQSQNSLKQIGMALHSYHDQHGQLPSPAITDEGGKPLLSWRVALLPYLDRQDLYDRFDLTEPWNGPTNAPLLAEMPDVFSSPSADLPEGHTVYLAIDDPEAVLTDDQTIQYSDIRDGMSNTAVVIEAAVSVPWLAPQDMSLERAVAEIVSGEPRIVLLADGSVRTLMPGDVDSEGARAIFTRAGDETVGF